MSALATHARAAWLMGEAFAEAAESCGDDRNGYLLARISQAYIRASAAMAAEVAARAQGVDSACTIDHATINVPKCAACGQPRG